MHNMEAVKLLEAAVFARRPVLKTILDRDGMSSLQDYARTLFSHPHPVDPARKEVCIDAISTHTHKMLGAPAAARVRAQLEQSYVVSTTDHLGPLTHPFFVHADLLAASAGIDSFIVLACSNVSLGNSSWPRGLLYHTDHTEYGRINFFPSHERMSPVFGFRGYTKEDIDRIVRNLERAQSMREISSALKNKLVALIETIYARPDVLSEKYYASQITKTNALLWQEFFDRSSVTLPDLVYLEQEAISSNLLQAHHLSSSTELYRLMFDPAVRASAYEAFADIPGAFSKDKSHGTFLFWLRTSHVKGRIALWPQGDALVSEDGTHTVPLDPQHIGTLLERGELIPSTLLSLITLSSYYGLKCLGGFSQVNYLTWIDEAYHRILGLSETYTPSSFTQGLCGDFMIALGKLPSGALVPATGLDLALHHDERSWPAFLESTKRLSLRESLGLMLPELYRILYTHEERDPALAALTHTDLLRASGLDTSLPPTIEISY